MGYKQQIEVIEQEELLFSDKTQRLQEMEQLMLMYSQLSTAKGLKWIKEVEQADYSSWNEVLTNPSKELSLPSLKNLYFSALYGSAPKKLRKSPSLTGMLSGIDSGGTPQKAKPNGKP